MNKTIKALNHELVILKSELKFSKDSLIGHTDIRTINYINQDIERKKEEIFEWVKLIAKIKCVIKNRESRKERLKNEI